MSTNFIPAGYADEDDEFDEDGFQLGCDDDLKSDCNGLGDAERHPQFESDPTSGEQGVIRSGFGPPPSQQDGFSFRRPNQETRNRKPLRILNEEGYSTSLYDYRGSVMRGDVSAIKKYLDQGVDVDTVLKSGWTALMYASNNGQAEMVRLLLERGADPNYQKDLYTALMSACTSNALEEDMLACVTCLLDAGADVNSHDRNFTTPLMYAARAGRCKVASQLVEYKADLNKQDTRGWTALVWAASKGLTAMLTLLLESGADPNKKCSDGQKAVDIAYGQGHEQIVTILDRVTDDRGSSLGKSIPSPSRSSRSSEKNRSATDGSTGENQKCIRYGEMELFLCGLELGHLVDVFQEQQVTFTDLLKMTDRKLEQVGIKQMGIRKKILDGIHEVHKKDWEQGSLPTLQYSKQLGCTEAVAVLANISKHADYVGCTVAYIKEQIKEDPKLLQGGQDGYGHQDLCKHTEKAIRNTQQLFTELTFLRERLAKVNKEDYQAPDLITSSNRKRRGRRVSKLAFCTLIGGAFLGLCYWKRDSILGWIYTVRDSAW